MALKDLLPDTLLPTGFKTWVEQASKRVDSIPDGGADGDLIGQDGAGSYYTVPGGPHLKTVAIGPDATVARPDTADIVYWVGTVEPDNAIIDDRLYRPDLNEDYRFDGASFVRIFSGTYNRRFMLDARNYGADTSGATSSVQAVKGALNDLPTDTDAPYGRGEVVISGGDFLIDSTIDVRRFQRIFVASDARLLVPQDSTFSAFRFLDPGDGERCLFARVHFDGTIEEKGTPGKAWTAFEWRGEGVDGAPSRGISWSWVEGNGSIWNPGTAFLLTTTTDGTGTSYITSCGARGITVYYPVVVYDWQPANAGEVRKNSFHEVLVQGSTSLTHGVRNLKGHGNAWYDCRLWDITGSQISMEITADATDTVVVGGDMTSATFTDNGTNTIVLDGPTGIQRGPRAIDRVINGLADQQVVLFFRIDDSVGKRLSGTLWGYRDEGSSITTVAEFHLNAAVDANNGSVHANAMKVGQLRNTISTIRLVEVDYNGFRWLGMELSGASGGTNYPNNLRFAGVAAGTGLPQVVALADTSNRAAHTPHTDYDTPIARITGDGEEPFAVTTDVNAGTATFSGDGSTVTFAVPHGLGSAPTARGVWAESAGAAGDKHVSSVDATNINVTFASAPASGTDNVVLGFDARL